MIRQLVSIFVVLVALGRSARAAEPANSAARQHTDAGTAEYNLGHYAEAARQYEEAYRLTRAPVLLFNIGQSYRLAGQLQPALTAYRSYLRTTPADAPNRAQVQRRIDELEKMAAQNPSPAAAPAPSTPPPPPPAPAISPPVAAPAAAPTPVQPVVLVNTPAPEASPPPVSRPFYTRTWFWAGAGVLIAGGVLAAILVGRGGTEANISGAMDPNLVVLR